MAMATAGNPSAEPPDAALFNALSNDAVRQQVVVQSVMMLSRRDPAAARQLADTYVTDPNMRAAADRMLAATSSGNPAMVRDPRFPAVQGPTSLIMGPNGTPIVLPAGPVGQAPVLLNPTGTMVAPVPGMRVPPPPGRSPERGRSPPSQ